MFKKILLAEDNLMNCKLVILGLKQYEIDVAYDGQEAIDHFSKNHYDLILMDLQMPVKTGIEATREIRAIEEAERREPKAVILGMTADWIPAVEEECKAAGIDDFLPKPFLPSQMVSILEESFKRISDSRIFQQ